MRLLAAGLLALTACGRIDFDERHLAGDAAAADKDPTRDAAIVSYDTTNGYTMLSQIDPGALHAGTGYNRIDMDPAATVARIGWSPSQFYDLSTPAAGYAHTDLIRFSLRGVDVSLRYIAIIESN